MKTVMIYSLLVILNIIVNFAIFNYSFVVQATQFLHEEQRVDSAMLSLQTTLPAYIVSAIITALIFYWVSRRHTR
ncbi:MULTISPECIES: hypothetical protein [unclassified Agarivorans]|uniref:hypothetical protein n=1 Tax=unclassified Agarivorans TaxID=2636026 RepID=UPI0026E2A79F|nr:MULTISPECIES: hypothetical protein [unclassified Agarivorans]MDO6686730.1 hypothetical protein [Agarivorans sp. 3_MG-2023]MDO6716540.1 hypothetical protein [Agarivorans sp. 2_MG-2023]